LYRIIVILIVALALALGLVIGTLNPDPASLDLLWIQIRWPMGLLVLSACAFGLLAGIALAWVFSVLPLRARLRKSRSRESADHSVR
jgi:uncharacterized integral membrane protein